MDAVEVDGLRIAYERVGSGPALALLHGYVGDGPTTWRPQLDGLSDEFTVIAWDAPGAGGSDDPPESFGMAGYADAFAGFVAAVGPAACVRRWAIVRQCAGHRGDPPAPGHVIATRARVGVRRVGWFARQGGHRAAVGAGAPAERAVARRVLRHLLPTMFSKGTDRAVVEAFGGSMRAVHPAGFRAMARASAEDLTGVLPAIGVPTLVVHGDQDVRAPRPVAEHLHAGIAGSELVVLPGAGHVCNLEAPDAFNANLREFLLRV